MNEEKTDTTNSVGQLKQVIVNDCVIYKGCWHMYHQ